MSGPKIFMFLFCFLVTTLCFGQQRISNLEMGKFELSRGRYTSAIEYLNVGLLQQADLYYGFYFRGIAKEALEDFVGAEQDYSKAILIYPERADVFDERAVVRYRLFNFTGAFEDFGRAVVLDSTDANIYYNRAVSLLSLNQFEAAIEDCNRAEGLKYKNENLYIIRGAAKAGLTRLREAISDYNKVINKNAKNTYALNERGNALWELSQKDSALMDFNTILKIDSSNVEALFNRSTVYMKDGQTDAALKDLNNAIGLSPDYGSAYFNRAIIYGNSKRYKESLLDYDKVLELNGENVLAYFNRAIVKSENKDLKGALKDYDKVIELYPDFADAYYNRSLLKKDLNNVWGSTGDYKKAMEIKQRNNLLSDSVKFTKGVQLMKLLRENSPDEKKNDANEKIQNSMADIQLRSVYWITLLPVSKNFRVFKSRDKQHYKNNEIVLVNTKDSVDTKTVKEEISKLGMVINKNPNDASTYLDRAILYGSIKSYNESMADYDKSIELNPKNPMAWFSRGNTRFKLLELIHSFDNEEPTENMKEKTKGTQAQSDNTYEMVINDYNKTLKLDSSFTYAWFNNANTKLLMGKYKEAADDLTKAIQFEPTLSDAYFNRGLILIFLGYKTEACKDISKAGELGIKEAYKVIKRYCYK